MIRDAGPLALRCLMKPRVRSTLVMSVAVWIAQALAGSEAVAQGRIPNFPQGIAVPDDSGRNGLAWLGSDSPYATYIGAGISFWAFGDTYLSVPGQAGRQLSGVVANTIAIGRVVGGNFIPAYYYRGTPDRRQAFFPNPGPTHKYWPKASVVVDGKLYVFLSLMYVNLAIPAGDPNGVRDTGTVIARVNNPLAPPTTWQIDYLALHYHNAGEANLMLGAEVLAAPGAGGLIVYGIFTNDKTKSYKGVVAMISNAALRDTPAGTGIDPTRCQYLAADASNANLRWKPGLGTFDGTADDYLDTRIDCVSGFTVRWNSLLARWQVVGAFSQFAAAFPYPKGHPYTPLPVARIYASPTPFGPFQGVPESSSCNFYTFPELNSKDETLCCYAVRQWQDMEDPRSSTDANLLFTYTFSTRDMNEQLANLKLYQNYAVLVPNPFSGPQDGPPLCADRPKLAPVPIPGNHPLADPFGAPGAPKPLAFPPRGSGAAAPPGSR